MLVASADKKDGEELQLENSKAKVKIQYGDFSEALTKAVDALTEVSDADYPPSKLSRLIQRTG